VSGGHGLRGPFRLISFFRYFGGSLELMTLEGWGTELFLCLFFGELMKCNAGTDVFLKLRSLEEAGDANI